MKRGFIEIPSSRGAGQTELRLASNISAVLTTITPPAYESPEDGPTFKHFIQIFDHLGVQALPPTIDPVVLAESAMAETEYPWVRSYSAAIRVKGGDPHPAVKNLEYAHSSYLPAPCIHALVDTTPELPEDQEYEVYVEKEAGKTYEWTPVKGNVIPKALISIHYDTATVVGATLGEMEKRIDKVWKHWDYEQSQAFERRVAKAIAKMATNTSEDSGDT